MSNMPVNRQRTTLILSLMQLSKICLNKLCLSKLFFISLSLLVCGEEVGRCSLTLGSGTRPIGPFHCPQGQALHFMALELGVPPFMSRIDIIIPANHSTKYFRGKPRRGGRAA